ncbi:MAG: ATP-binding protein [Candidatus Omnitrophota bacterium]
MNNEMTAERQRIKKQKGDSGRLRIGDDWNAITIIALSQNNPLKAIAEFVENSIDAEAKHITIIRGKEKGLPYLKIADDGNGIPCTDEGVPDFKYVATHICDSLKRRLKEQGIKNIQGEFGIGLLSFWTVGHKLTMISSGKDGKVYQMEMGKGHPGYTIIPRSRLFPVGGTQLTISPLLAGIRQLSGEKMQRFLSSELRDRIRHSGVKIKIIDRSARAEFDVMPRRYSGRLLHNLSKITTSLADIYMELYLNEKSAENHISLFRSGTRVLPSVTVLDEFQDEPWTSGYFQGIIDAPFLHLTPGTRDGIIHDERFSMLCRALLPVKEQLQTVAAEQDKAEEERMSKNILRSVQKALRGAILDLPKEEYDWFEIYEKGRRGFDLRDGREADISGRDGRVMPVDEDAFEENIEERQKKFFEFAGPLFSARVRPASALVETGKTKSLRAIGSDRKKQQVEENLSFEWEIAEGAGELDKRDGEIVIFKAPEEPGLTKIKLSVKQADIVCEAEAVMTIVENLIKPSAGGTEFSKGLPGYTLESSAAHLWRSRYDNKRNIIVINSGHRDFIYAGRQKVRKLRYICRLFAKELIYHNFTGQSAEQLLERMVELSLYTEENLR